MMHGIVIGSGFAGLWAALGAARRLDELDVKPGMVDTVLSELLAAAAPQLQFRPALGH